MLWDEGGCCCLVLCCWGGDAGENNKVLPEVRWSTTAKIHLLSGLHHGRAKLKLVKKGMG